MHSYGDHLPEHMINERPKTAISKRGGNTHAFDENDDVADLLPD